MTEFENFAPCRYAGENPKFFGRQGVVFLDTALQAFVFIAHEQLPIARQITYLTVRKVSNYEKLRLPTLKNVEF